MALSNPVVIGTPAATSTTTTISTTFTPSANALVFAVGFNTAGGSGNLPGNISSSPSLSWTLVGATGTTAATTGGLRIWAAKAPGTPVSTTATITLDGTPTIQDMLVFETTGYDTTTPIFGRQSTTGTTSPLTVSLASGAAPTVDDLTVVAVSSRNSSNEPTLDGTFTKLVGKNTSSPSADYVIGWRKSASTSGQVSNFSTAYNAVEMFGIRVAPAVTPVYRTHIWTGAVWKKLKDPVKS